MTSSFRIAIVGSGITGLGAALRLGKQHRVTLFEADARAGGHAHSVDVRLDDITYPVDTGFLVFNHRTYPRLRALFEQLKVSTVATDMSFAVSLQEQDLEWCGSTLASLFAQKSNLLSIAHWHMLIDILRFNRQATAIAGADTTQGVRPPAGSDLTLGQFLARFGYGKSFAQRYLLPMAAAIWSSPLQQTLDFPVKSFAQFCHNHGLLQITQRPTWYTVEAGSRSYVDAAVAQLDDVRLGCPVDQVRSIPEGILVSYRDSSDTSFRQDEVFDRVIFACHSDQALQLLADASAAETAILSKIRFQPNTAVLHTDESLMPRRKQAWAAWNYLSAAAPGTGQSERVSVTYWLNRLQPLPFKTQVFVSLNPLTPPDPAKTLGQFQYQHPLLGAEAVSAQQQLHLIQGRRHIWFAGAWTRFGFHEDGLMSGQSAADEVLAATAVQSASLVPPIDLAA